MKFVHFILRKILRFVPDVRFKAKIAPNPISWGERKGNEGNEGKLRTPQGLVYTPYCNVWKVPWLRRTPLIVPKIVESAVVKQLDRQRLIPRHQWPVCFTAVTSRQKRPCCVTCRISLLLLAHVHWILILIGLSVALDCQLLLRQLHREFGLSHFVPGLRHSARTTSLPLEFTQCHV